MYSIILSPVSRLIWSFGLRLIREFVKAPILTMQRGTVLDTARIFCDPLNTWG